MSQLTVPSEQTITWRPLATDVSQAFFISDARYLVKSIREVHTSPSASGTLNLEKLSGTVTPGGGTLMLASPIDLTSTPNQVSTGDLTANMLDRYINPNERVSAVFGGTLTGLLGCVITLTLQRA